MTERDPLDLLGEVAGSSEEPDPDFARRLLADLTDQLTATRPAPVSDVTSAMEPLGLAAEPETDTSTRRWLPLVVAAAITALIVGFVVTSTSDDSGQPVIQAPPPAPASTTPPTPAPDAGQSAAATAVGDAFVDAFAIGDANGAVAHLSDTPATIDLFGVTEPDDLIRLFAWFDVVDTTFEPQGCTFREPDQVACTAAHRNAWYGPVDLDPVESRFVLKVEGGRITAVRWGIDCVAHCQATDPFLFFVNDTDPDHLTVMFETAPAGDLRHPRLTEESLALFEAYTAAYLAASDDGQARTQQSQE